MPPPNTKYAPRKFKGASHRILEFITTYEKLLRRNNVTSDKERCEAILPYCSHVVQEVIEGMQDYVQPNWEGLRATLLRFYNADQRNLRFTEQDLQDFAEESSDEDIRAKKYWRNKNRTKKKEKSKGKAVRFEDDSNEAKASKDMQTATAASKGSNSKKSSPEPVAEVIRQMQNMSLDSKEYAVRYYQAIKADADAKLVLAAPILRIPPARAPQQAYPLPPPQIPVSASAYQAQATPMMARPSGCFGCDDPGHRIRECPAINKLLDDKVIMRGVDGRFAMADGSRIPWRTGESLVKAIEHATPAQVHFVSASAHASSSDEEEERPVFALTRSQGPAGKMAKYENQKYGKDTQNLECARQQWSTLKYKQNETKPIPIILTFASTGVLERVPQPGAPESGIVLTAATNDDNDGTDVPIGIVSPSLGHENRPGTASVGPRSPTTSNSAVALSPPLLWQPRRVSTPPHSLHLRPAYHRVPTAHANSPGLGSASPNKPEQAPQPGVPVSTAASTTADDNTAHKDDDADIVSVALDFNSAVPAPGTNSTTGNDDTAHNDDDADIGVVSSALGHEDRPSRTVSVGLTLPAPSNSPTAPSSSPLWQPRHLPAPPPPPLLREAGNRALAAHTASSGSGLASLSRAKQEPEPAAPEPGSGSTTEYDTTAHNNDGTEVRIGIVSAVLDHKNRPLCVTEGTTMSMASDIAAEPLSHLPGERHDSRPPSSPSHSEHQNAGDNSPRELTIACGYSTPNWASILQDQLPLLLPLVPEAATLNRENPAAGRVQMRGNSTLSQDPVPRRMPPIHHQTHELQLSKYPEESFSITLTTTRRSSRVPLLADAKLFPLFKFPNLKLGIAQKRLPNSQYYRYAQHCDEPRIEDREEDYLPESKINSSTADEEEAELARLGNDMRPTEPTPSITPPPTDFEGPPLQRMTDPGHRFPAGTAYLSSDVCFRLHVSEETDRNFEDWLMLRAGFMAPHLPGISINTGGRARYGHAFIRFYPESVPPSHFDSLHTLAINMMMNSLKTTGAAAPDINTSVPANLAMLADLAAAVSQAQAQIRIDANGHAPPAIADSQPVAEAIRLEEEGSPSCMNTCTLLSAGNTNRKTCPALPKCIMHDDEDYRPSVGFKVPPPHGNWGACGRRRGRAATPYTKKGKGKGKENTPSPIPGPRFTPKKVFTPTRKSPGLITPESHRRPGVSYTTAAHIVKRPTLANLVNGAGGAGSPPYAVHSPSPGSGLSYPIYRPSPASSGGIFKSIQRTIDLSSPTLSPRRTVDLPKAPELPRSSSPAVSATSKMDTDEDIPPLMTVSSNSTPDSKGPPTPQVSPKPARGRIYVMTGAELRRQAYGPSPKKKTAPPARRETATDAVWQSSFRQAFRLGQSVATFKADNEARMNQEKQARPEPTGTIYAQLSNGTVSRFPYYLPAAPTPIPTPVDHAPRPATSRGPPTNRPTFDAVGVYRHLHAAQAPPPTTPRLGPSGQMPPPPAPRPASRTAPRLQAAVVPWPGHAPASNASAGSDSGAALCGPILRQIVPPPVAMAIPYPPPPVPTAATPAMYPLPPNALVPPQVAAIIVENMRRMHIHQHNLTSAVNGSASHLSSLERLIRDSNGEVYDFLTRVMQKVEILETIIEGF
ncbi:hypothetical protein PUNSTDRAFT_46264 [Punctularia strigosozonata HHB-11173 SS5]|uniref:uncharacterized protein n=1 Tax=Punctularia strigosozonata (strain HHB-11173) TaxID=741275 RepID=UPI0004416B01|nr:uncharacterized protein PUNSTDRAFT_46264 [Punctularia strigosozonata HHB-11173 SS5]EIN05947.1 hypothetical protein PUNSTDRAFT_46264 [Punctularia strigosozonata HHB-11173 SS5]